jgi:hypothetical protein
MKRRDFLSIAATAGAAGLILPGGLAASGQSVDALAHPHVLEVLREPRLVAQLGMRYREVAPEESDQAALTAAILRDLDGMADEPLGARLDARVRRDFVAGRTVTLHGWLLSVTEARQCALYSLLAQAL